MLLLLILAFASDIGGSPGASIRTPINSHQNKKSLKEFVTIVKSLTSNITVTERRKLFVDVIFKVADRALDLSANGEIVQSVKEIERQVEEIGFDITNALQKAKDICAQTLFEEISIRAGALLSLLLRAVLGLFEGNDTFVRILSEVCEHGSTLRLDLNEIPMLLNSSNYNPLKTSIEADKFHKLSTMEETKNRILGTANTLVLVEGFRMRFANEPDQHEQVESLLDIVHEYDFPALRNTRIAMQEYFAKKVPLIIRDVMENIKTDDDQIRARALMNHLIEIHSNDRFVVAVYNNECDIARILHYRPNESNIVVDRNHRTIVYRSKNASKIKYNYPNGLFKPLQREKNVPHPCIDLTAKMIYAHSRNNERVGLVLCAECAVAVEQDNRWFIREYEDVSCVDSNRGFKKQTFLAYPR